MKVRFLPVVIVACMISNLAYGQSLYVDPTAGNDTFAGSKEQPLRTIAQAIADSRKFDGRQPIMIKLLPGLHLLTGQVVIDSLPVPHDTSMFSIEAVVLPGDTAWRPEMMPVIQSVSGNNKDYGSFNHCIGFQVERSRVTFRGLKFTGNAHPRVQYYYVIERHKPYLDGLNISHCLFVGEQYSAAIQGAVFAQGPHILIEHCTFYNCKNAVLSFLNVQGFSLTYSIIYGAYEGAIWLGWKEYADLPFIFHHNIIAKSAYAWIGYKATHHHYVFEEAVFAGNGHHIGFNTQPVQEDNTSKRLEHNVVHAGNIVLDDKLLLLPGSTGNNLGAGYK